MPSLSSSSSSSSEEAAHFEQYYEYLPPAEGTSRRPAASSRVDRAGGYPSDMPSSHYGSEPRRSVPEIRRPLPYNPLPGRLNVGGNRDDGRTRAQGGRVTGDFHNGHGSSRRQERPNAREGLESRDRYFPNNAGYPRTNSRDRDPLRSHNATAQAPADPWESGSSMILDATDPRVQAWVHDTSSRHNAGNTRADPVSRHAGAVPSSRSGRGYVDASTQTW